MIPEDFTADFLDDFLEQERGAGLHADIAPDYIHTINLDAYDKYENN